MKIENQVAVVTGAASGIGRAVVSKLVLAGAKAVACVDIDERVKGLESAICKPFVGSTTDEDFRRSVFDGVSQIGLPTICVPAAGITRDALAIKIDKETGKASIYPVERFKLVLDVNLVAPTYWGLEMVARIAEAKGRWAATDELRGTVVFIGSIISQGNKGQVSYAATKKGLVAVADTMNKEAMFYGVKFGVVHPGYTDTPMVQAVPQEIINEKVLPSTQLKRLIRPDEIAEAVCFMISNSATTREIWVDAGWQPAP